MRMVMMIKPQERRVWIYWENPQGRSEAPSYIALCREILVKNCSSCAVTLVTPENLSDYLPDIPWNLNSICLNSNPYETCIALKCDFIRAFLLERYGGIYIDSDAIALRDLGSVFDLFDEWDFIGMRRTSSKTKHISVGFYGSRAGGKVISLYAEKLRRMLAERSTSEWDDAGAWAITPIVDEFSEDCYLFPENRIQPITPRTKNAFLSREELLENYLKPDPLMFMLFHKVFENQLRDWSVDDFLSGDILLSKIFRYASKVD